MENTKSNKKIDKVTLSIDLKTRKSDSKKYYHIKFKNIGNSEVRTIMNNLNGKLDEGISITFGIREDFDSLIINVPYNISKEFFDFKYRRNKTGKRYIMPSTQGGFNKIFEEMSKETKMAALPEIKKMNSYVRAIVTDDDISEREEKMSKNWAYIMNNLNDPEVRKKLLKFQCSLAFERKYGWVLSKHNMREILLTKPDASFVLTEKEWFEKYNRVVKPNAEKIIITKGANNLASDEELRQAALAHGFNGNVPNANQVKKGIQARANFHYGIPVHAPKLAVFDISDTILINGKPDKWAEEPGYISNLTGEPNNAALKFEKENSEDFEQKLKEWEAKKSEYKSKATSTIIANAKKFLKKKSASTIMSSDSEIVSQCAFSLATKYAKDTLNLVSNKEITKFANNVTYMVMSILEMGYSGASRFDFKQKWNNEDGSRYYRCVLNILNYLEKENKELSTVSECFNGILNKINNVVF